MAHLSGIGDLGYNMAAYARLDRHWPMSAEPSVSIVIPAYNYAQYVPEAIESVLNQTYPNTELIVIDDGSTDGTAQVLERFGKAFYWESQQNMGQARTLNKGWELAQGNILSYLSADDRLLPDAVSQAVRYLKENPDVVLTYCDFNLIDSDSRIIRHVNSPDFNYFDMVVKTVCMPGPGVFFTRAAFERVGGWNPAFRQMPDFEYWLRLGLCGPFVRIPQVLAEFRAHDTSQTFARTPEDRADEPIRILDKFYRENQPLPPDISAARGRAIGSAHLVSAQLHFRAGRYYRGFSRLRAGFSSYWKHLLYPRTYRLCLHGILSRPSYLFRAGLRQLVSPSHHR